MFSPICFLQSLPTIHLFLWYRMNTNTGYWIRVMTALKPDDQ